MTYLLKYVYAPQTGNAKNPPLNCPSKYKPPGGLYLENYTVSTVALIKFFSPQMWRLFEGGIYFRWKLDETKNFFNYDIVIFHIKQN